MRKRLTQLAILLTCSLLATAVDLSNYTFTSYKYELGFAQREVMNILQDGDGQMWFATWDGLYRFDGYRFSNFKARPGDGIRLESNRIERICLDGDNIWMLGYTGVVSRFDKRTHKIENIGLSREGVATALTPLPTGGVVVQLADGRIVIARANGDEDVLSTIESKCPAEGCVINKTFVADDSTAWVLTSKGLWRCHTDTGQMSSVAEGVNVTNMAAAPGKTVFCGTEGRIVVMQDGKVTTKRLPTTADLTSVATLPDGGMLCSTQGDGLYVLRQDYTVAQHFRTEDSALPSNRLTTMRQDSHGDVWFCTDKPGVMRYDRERKTLECFYLQGEFSNDPAMWINGIYLEEDSHGHVWLTPSGNGLAMYDRGSGTMVPVINKKYHETWTAENTAVTLFVDRQDNVWFCDKYTGLQKATYNRPQFDILSAEPTDGSAHDVRGVFQDSKGRIWVGAKNEVISVYDSHLRFVGNLTPEGTLSPTSRTPVGRAYAFAEQKDGVIWIATKLRGLIRLQPRQDNTFGVRHFVADGKPYSLPHNDIFTLCIDRHNRLWIGSFGGGLCYTRLDDDTFRFIHARNDLVNYSMEKFNKVRSVTADSHGDIWVCTISGLLRFSDDFERPQDIRFKLYSRQADDATSLSHNDVLEVFFTRSDSMYVCTYSGGFCRAVRCQGDSLRFVPYTTANGLRSDVIFSVQEDDRGYLWFAYESGFVRYSPRNNSLEHFATEVLGRQIDINEGRAIRLHDGRLFYPSRNCKAVCFYPDSVQVSDFVPRIAFTRLFLDQKEQLPAADGKAILRQDLNETDRIVLANGINSINLEFAALDYCNPSNISYAYMLEGVDAEWNMAGNHHAAIYNNLPPGDYTLKVRSTNSDGVWVDNLRSIEIEVKPSFWQTGWAWTLYFLTVVLLIGCATYILTTIWNLKQKVFIEQELSDLKMKFFTNISHEIRTPLTLISGSIKEVLRKGVNDEELHDTLHVVNENSNRLLRLVTQILDIRKIESGNMKLSLRQMDLCEFVASLADNFRNLAKERGIRLMVNRPDDPIFIWADTEKVDKIVFNLLSNAFRFTPSGKGITVSVERTSRGVRLTVADEGKGIEPERTKTIFRLFDSDNDGSQSAHPHTGIGLALTKELVELHHGTIRVESEVGKGSAFIVDLPVNEPGKDIHADYILTDNVNPTVHDVDYRMEGEATEPSIGSVVPLAEGEEGSSQRRETILVVEDNADMRRFICLILRQEYQLMEAADGKEGLEKACAAQPDIIISDYMMPEMDGLEMAQRLRSDVTVSHIPIIILSARTDEDSIIKGLRTGVDAYIEKPFSAEVLRARIANLITMRRNLQKAYMDKYIDKRTDDSGMAAADEPTGISAVAVDADRLFLDKLTSLLEENLSKDDLSVDDVAKMMGMSRSVYFKKVKALVGIGPNDYLKFMRLQRASELLSRTDMSIADISYQIGIPDSHYFSKCFKAKYGATPTEWRSRKN